MEQAARSSARSALVAGSGLFPLFIPALLLFGAAGALFGRIANIGSAPVKSYAGLLQVCTMEHSISEHAEFIAAGMMQESRGQSNDPTHFNTKYPKTPGGITGPEYSINIEIQNLACSLSQAGPKDPADIERISLALQGYNFGSGYISWVLANYGGYTKLNALKFSAMIAQRLGWLIYGDPYYVQHMLRYYAFGGTQPNLLYRLEAVWYSKKFWQENRGIGSSL